MDLERNKRQNDKRRQSAQSAAPNAEAFWNWSAEGGERSGLPTANVPYSDWSLEKEFAGLGIPIDPPRQQIRLSQRIPQPTVGP